MLAVIPLALARPAVAQDTSGSALSLTAQSYWVGPGSTFVLGLKIRSSLPASRLSIKVSVYSRSTSTSAFDASLSGSGIAKQVPLSTTRSITLRGQPGNGPTDTNLTTRIALSMNESAKSISPGPSLSLDCAPSYCSGVYPVEIALVDSLKGAPLSDFVTHLVYLAQPAGSIPLQVGLVVPLGSNLVLGPTGNATLSAANLTSLSRVLSTLRTHRNIGLTVALYPQLLVALRRTPTPSGSAAAVINALRALLLGSPGSAPPELARTTFAPMDLEGLAAPERVAELSTQFARANQTLHGVLGTTVNPALYVSPTALDASSVLALQQLGVDQLVLPQQSLSLTPFDLTNTAPFVLELPGTNQASNSGAGSPTVFSTNAELTAGFVHPGANAVLEAHRLIAELAQIYFERPADGGRGVIIAPASWSENSSFLSSFLTGLASLPVIAPNRLTEMFSNIAIGADQNPTSAELAGLSPPANLLGSHALDTARRAIANVAAVVPTDDALQQRLSDSVLLAESPIGSDAQARYLDAASATLHGIGESLSILSGRSVTLTSRTGEIPITIRTLGLRPMHVLMRLSSADLQFRNGLSEIVLKQKDNPRLLSISARTSGAFNLKLTLASPNGAYVFASSQFTVRSTAVSGVAIALSLGALAVLLWWWLRSVLRHRRRPKTGQLDSASSSVS